MKKQVFWYESEWEQIRSAASISAVSVTSFCVACLRTSLENGLPPAISRPTQRGVPKDQRPATHAQELGMADPLREAVRIAAKKAGIRGTHYIRRAVWPAVEETLKNGAPPAWLMPTLAPATRHFDQEMSGLLRTFGRVVSRKSFAESSTEELRAVRDALEAEIKKREESRPSAAPAAPGWRR